MSAYEQGGAAALSVLTDARHFGGSLEDLREARAACALPVLQKDFIVDPYQLYEAAAAGADAVLLIVAALRQDQLSQLYGEARGLDLDVVVEVHREKELEAALTVDADMVGINNRNLDDFTVDVQTTFELMPDVPAGKTVVSESGIAERGTLEELERVGVDAVLIGEALMRAGTQPQKSESSPRTRSRPESISSRAALIVLPVALAHHQVHGSPIGYAAIALAAAVGWFGLPGPGEAAVIAGGIFAAKHRLDIGMVITAAAAGAAAGGTAGWLVGMKASRPVLIGRRGPFWRRAGT